MSPTPIPTAADISKMMRLPSIQAAFAEESAAVEAAAADARKAALDEKAAVQHELDELASQSAGMGVDIAQLEHEIHELQRQRNTITAAMQRSKARLRTIAIAIRDEHGGRLITHVVNYLNGMAENATNFAEVHAARMSKAGTNILGDAILKPSTEGTEKAQEMRQSAIDLRHAAENIAALELEAIAPQEIRRRIQAELEIVGLTLYNGTLPESMITRQVHAEGAGQERGVEQLPPKIAA